MDIQQGVVNYLVYKMRPCKEAGAVAGFLSASTIDFRLKMEDGRWKIKDFWSPVVDYEGWFMRMWINAVSLFYYRVRVNLLKKVNENG